MMVLFNHGGKMKKRLIFLFFEGGNTRKVSLTKTSMEGMRHQRYIFGSRNR